MSPCTPESEGSPRSETEGKIDVSMLAFHSEHFEEVAKEALLEVQEVPQEDDQPDLDHIRDRLLGRFSDGFEGEWLDEALSKCPTSCQAGAVVASAPPPKEDEASPAAAVVLARVQALPAVVQTECQELPAAQLLLQALLQRDRRIGELTAEIASTELRIAAQEENLRKMEKSVGSWRLEAAHIDLDVEWHRGVLLGADERN